MLTTSLLKTLSVSIVLIVLLALGQAEARAEPVVITNGSINFNGNTIFSTFSLEGAGLSVHGGTNYSYLNGSFLLAPGGTFLVGQTMTASNLLSVRTPLTINGITYNHFGSSVDSLLLRNSASSFVLPLDTTIGSVSFTTPFSTTGLILLSARPGEPIPRADFVGEGIATVVFNVGLEGAWHLSDFTYTFNQPPTPTPEPATLFLLGTGVSGLAGLVRRRRKRGRSS